VPVANDRLFGGAAAPEIYFRMHHLPAKGSIGPPVCCRENWKQQAVLQQPSDKTKGYPCMGSPFVLSINASESFIA